jgi:hypothetical protein
MILVLPRRRRLRFSLSVPAFLTGSAGEVGLVQRLDAAGLQDPGQVRRDAGPVEDLVVFAAGEAGEQPLVDVAAHEGEVLEQLPGDRDPVRDPLHREAGLGEGEGRFGFDAAGHAGAVDHGRFRDFDGRVGEAALLQDGDAVARGREVEQHVAHDERRFHAAVDRRQDLREEEGRARRPAGDEGADLFGFIPSVQSAPLFSGKRLPTSTGSRITPRALLRASSNCSEAMNF